MTRWARTGLRGGWGSRHHGIWPRNASHRGAKSARQLEVRGCRGLRAEAALSGAQNLSPHGRMGRVIGWDSPAPHFDPRFEVLVSEVDASKPGPMNIGAKASCRSACPIRPRRFSPAPAVFRLGAGTQALPSMGRALWLRSSATCSARGGIGFGNLCVDDVTRPGLAMLMTQDGSRRGGRKKIGLGY